MRRLSLASGGCHVSEGAKNEPGTSQVRCHASRQTPACASTAGAFLKERANDGVRVLVKDCWKCWFYCVYEIYFVKSYLLNYLLIVITKISG